MSTEISAEEMRALGHPSRSGPTVLAISYPAHSHAYKKVLCCLEGSIVFHLANDDVSLSAGDRAVVEPRVEHSATVGPAGVRCAEAHVS